MTMQRLTTAQLAALSSADKGAVTGLDLSNSTETDFSVLAQLPNLAALSLLGSTIVDLSPLAGLSNLKWLDLSHTQVSAVAPLAGLTGLKFLDLSGTLLGNQWVPNGNFAAGVAGWFDSGVDTAGNARGTFAAAAGGGLVLHGPYASAGSPAFPVVPGQTYRVTFRCSAGSGTQAVYLWMMHSAVNVGEITAQNMTGYSTFVANGSVASVPTDYAYDWTCPAGVYFASAQVLEWAGGTADITVASVSVQAPVSSLAALTGLQALSFSGTQIADVSPLATLTALTSLNLSAIPGLSDVSPLATLAALKSLSLAHTPVTDVSSLAGISGLAISR